MTLTMVSPEIEKYAVEHTTALPPHMDALMRATHDKRDDAAMLSGPIEGTLLQILALAVAAKRILEVGTFTGFSAQMMAAVLPEDGELITCDIDEETGAFARHHIEQGPLAGKITQRFSPALETMATLKAPFDLVFIDADKENYIAYYERAMELLSPTGIIAIDNALWGGRVLDPKESSDRAIAALNDHVKADARVRHVLLPVRDGVMVVTPNR
jgi:caffeoyl-CoA O-methyltransferase